MCLLKEEERKKSQESGSCSIMMGFKNQGSTIPWFGSNYMRDNLNVLDVRLGSVKNAKTWLDKFLFIFLIFCFNVEYIKNKNPVI